MLLKKIRNIIILGSMLINSACVEEYWPELDKYENLLVVDGLLTNGIEPGIVRLSFSSHLNNEIIIPASGAEVYFTDENQTTTTLIETEPGTYLVSDSSFRGQVGKTYQLNVNMPDGENYRSEYCRLQNPSPIDSLYGVLESDEFGNLNHDFPGIQFYIDNHSDLPDTSYYLWKLYQTYEYRASFDLDYTWEGEFIPFPKPDSLKTCWRTVVATEIFTTSTKFFDTPSITRFPLNFVSTETKMLSRRYSLLVRQLSISESAYNFYVGVKEQNDEQGSLWSQQPYQIPGNMFNINNPERPALGFFIVAGVSEKRIFVDRPNLVFYYTECTPDFEWGRWLPYEPESNWPFYFDDIMFLGWATADQKSCFDCREDGGSLAPPDFWE